MDKKVSFKNVLMVWIGIITMYTFYQYSLLDSVLNTVKQSGVNSLEDSTLITLIVTGQILVLIFILVGLMLVSIIFYFFGVLMQDDTSKTKYLYIISVVVFFNMLITVPLGCLNLFEGDKLITPSTNLYFVMFNPFLMLAIYVFYRLLSTTKLKRIVIVIYCVTYYLFQIASQTLL
ncbi:hypothetical protein IBT50_06115 [Bacillus sp. S70]|jgi:hypothetical protein|uniref:Yip1 domain-containing protein n=2 Tax=Bacillus TaxID=1386 RepID=A0A9X6QTP5_BACUH|nr:MULTISPECIES: hypothetical protein [Bacillus]MED2789934.1 hypothetical protein [Bacillus thuringiensis]MBJ9979739.1 hypothetical protein [Bacillus sp. S29]MBK0100917.1 hypothetical protein [Bacillus sp. S70]MBK0105535.1 hypothetical protein [Bacillus sp. S73]MBK0134366.1 hypothetical protein [Bacillus sp. S72]